MVPNTKAATIAPVAIRYRFNGDLQWQYTERHEQATQPCEIENLVTESVVLDLQKLLQESLDRESNARAVAATLYTALNDASSVVDKGDEEEYKYQAELESGAQLLGITRGQCAATESENGYRKMINTAEVSLEVRLPRAEAEKLVEAYLDEEAPGYPTYNLIEDGEYGWAFWIDPNDTTSYVHSDGRIEWYGSAWPDFVEYDGDTGNFREKKAVEVSAP